jgi:hypothetical protein
MIDSNQYIRLLEQALSSLGFGEIAAQLEAASGVSSQPKEVRTLCHLHWATFGCCSPSCEQLQVAYYSLQVVQLQRAVNVGDWADAIRQLCRLGLDGDALQQAQFIIHEQAFLEALQRDDSAAALQCLREQLARLGVNPGRLHELAGCLLRRSDGTRELFPGNKKAKEQMYSYWRIKPSDCRESVLQRLQASWRLTVRRLSFCP